ncbi:hypothetical protein [Flavobacterium capsici]|uniref:Uncharacterized protein n=1 Tax=Flavobacterium capsici TaxID=3075618 RepID=A0AA96EYC5_9FLAO|nr:MULTISPECIES: hypothetical protein [unclassified Flavobacterium]WNM19292.1 hypothetical protein RN608_01085 [Flavobacterium sp. PMR2A8]WNM20681.1 hypothetical protein RN605_08255 [Flavobacterium sp. PMTSA4]
MIPLLLIGTAIAIAAASSEKEKNKLGAVKNLINRYSSRGSKIDVNNLKPQASIMAINKIIDGKVEDYTLDKARTGSIYLKFYVPKTEIDFSVRVSDHSKIDGVDDDTIYDYGNEIDINIFSKERKDEAIIFLKNYFSKIEKLSVNKNVFINKVEKKVIKSKHPEIVIKLFKKLKINYSKTDKQIQQQILEKIIELKPTAVLTKKEYQKSRGLFRYVGESKIKGVVTHISSTGGMISIKGETGKDFTFDDKKIIALKNIATNNTSQWEHFANDYFKK